jgi:prepilin-type N-terminal cleavage/methylation domain-containing protein
MIARPASNKQRGGGGMTLAEIMVALAILGIVLSVCYGSSVALQRGFASTTFLDRRANQSAARARFFGSGSPQCHR